MKPVERPFFYEKYLHLIEGEDSEGHLEKMDLELNEINSESRTLGFVKHFYPILLLLVIPLILLTLTLYIKEGWSYRLIPGIASLVFLLFKKGQLNNLKKSKGDKGSYANTKERVFGKITNGRRILEEKMFRLNFLEQLYIGFFPWILFLASYLVLGKMSGLEVALGLSLAYIVSGGVWYYFFEQETNKISPLVKSIEELQNVYFKV